MHAAQDPPKTWDDVVPFMKKGGYHCLLPEAQSSSVHISPVLWLPKVTKMMQSKPSHMDWLKKWITVAFNGGSNPNVLRIDPLLESEIIGVFFEVGWHVCTGNPDEARRVLDKYKHNHKSAQLPDSALQVLVDVSSRDYDRSESSFPETEKMDYVRSNNSRYSKNPCYTKNSHHIKNPRLTCTASTLISLERKQQHRKLPRLRTTLSTETVADSQIRSRQDSEREDRRLRRARQKFITVGTKTQRSFRKRLRLSLELPEERMLNGPWSPLTPIVPEESPPCDQMPTEHMGPPATELIGKLVDPQQILSFAEPMDLDVAGGSTAGTGVSAEHLLNAREELDHARETSPSPTISPSHGIAQNPVEAMISSDLNSQQLYELHSLPGSSPISWCPDSDDTAMSSLTLVPEERDYFPDPLNFSAGSTGISPPAVISLSMDLLRASNFGLEVEPPWRIQHNTLDLPSDARIPNANDTHFWSLPPSIKLIRSASVDFPPLPLQPPLTSYTHKPNLPMTPPVWAQSRQELCESLSYFRSYQGGVYSQKKRARGYLLDGHPAVQDLWYAEGRCIISHGGGNSALNKQTRQTVLIEDQTFRTKSCAALINSWKAQQPIVLIAGGGYNLFPYDLEHRSYVVLGFYTIAHAWEEPEPSSASPRGYFVRWKFMFQWLEAQGKPWWISTESQTYQPRDSRGVPFPGDVCAHCCQHSPIIYNFGWVCLHSDCLLFFRRKNPAPGPSIAGYHVGFLGQKKDPPGCQGLRLDIRPQLPAEPKKKLNGKEHRQEATSRHFWKGWWCDKCGRLSCREYWTHWECNSCRHIFKIKSSIQPAQTLSLSVKRTVIQSLPSAGITTNVRVISVGPHSLRCHSFALPWNRGTIHLVQANASTQASVDDIWYQYQVDALKRPEFFKRYSMQTHRLRGRMLSHYFSQNSGESYQYVGGTDNTVPLHEYSSVSQALTMIRSKTSAVLGEDVNFNEILSAAYMAEQKMECTSEFGP
ncbi:hypothetical protein K439DRAFT_1395975 [Ramaria rubella]|nr:hypothetical protein K439DRAFT_1395975 [Ramaria rubella]